MSDLNFEYNGVTYANFTVEAALAAGVSRSVIDTELARVRREQIKTECRRRIYGIASSEAQANISGAATIISARSADERSADDRAFLITYEASLTWIMAMRAAVEALDDDPDADILADASWPECPAEVVTLAAQF